MPKCSLTRSSASEKLRSRKQNKFLVSGLEFRVQPKTQSSKLATVKAPEGPCRQSQLRGRYGGVRYQCLASCSALLFRLSEQQKESTRPTFLPLPEPHR